MNEADQQLLARRQKLLGPNARLFYDEPIHLVSGKGAWVKDAAGQTYSTAIIMCRMSVIATHMWWMRFANRPQH